jgi:hypothetical protein
MMVLFEKGMERKHMGVGESNPQLGISFILSLCRSKTLRMHR